MASPELIKVLSDIKKDIAYIENKISKKIILTPKITIVMGEYNILTVLLNPSQLLLICASQFFRGSHWDQE